MVLTIQQERIFGRIDEHLVADPVSRKFAESGAVVRLTPQERVPHGNSD